MGESNTVVSAYTMYRHLQHDMAKGGLVYPEDSQQKQDIT